MTMEASEESFGGKHVSYMQYLSLPTQLIM